MFLVWPQLSSLCLYENIVFPIKKPRPGQPEISDLPSAPGSPIERVELPKFITVRAPCRKYIHSRFGSCLFLLRTSLLPPEVIHPCLQCRHKDSSSLASPQSPLFDQQVLENVNYPPIVFHLPWAWGHISRLFVTGQGKFTRYRSVHGPATGLGSTSIGGGEVMMQCCAGAPKRPSMPQESIGEARRLGLWYPTSPWWSNG